MRRLDGPKVDRRTASLAMLAWWAGAARGMDEPPRNSLLPNLLPRRFRRSDEMSENGQAPTDPRIVPADHAALADEKNVVESAAQESIVPEAPKAARDLGPAHSLDPALAILYKARERYLTIRTYTATFVKQERIGQTLGPEQFLEAKFRNTPFAVYLKWIEPDAGKEMLFAEGQNDGKVLYHTTGFTRVLTGALRMDPEGPSARKDSRLSIRELGIGAMIDRMIARWEFERKFQETRCEVQHVKVNGRPCVQFSAVHPQPDDGKFTFHTQRVFIDKEHRLPIRTEGYGYPAEPGRTPGELVESYSYVDLRLDAGLTDIDFSPKNPLYNFSRF